MIRLIIFDWDDVFTLGAKEGYYACLEAALEEVGVTLSSPEFKRRLREVWGSTHREALQALLKEHPELWEQSYKSYEENLFGDTFVNSLTLVPGVIPLLERLHKKYVMCLATGVHPDVLRNVLMPKFGIPDVFSQVVSAYHITEKQNHKPNKFMAEEILKTQKIPKEEAILVGDHENDINMAKNAGITPVVVLSGHLTREEAKELNVEHILEDVTQLETVL